MNQIETQLMELLKEGPAHFTFTKKDGTERKAHGTRNAVIINERIQAGDAGTAEEFKTSFEEHHSTGAFVYYDLDKNAWRSFSFGSLVSIDE